MLINLRNALMAGKRLPYDAEVEYLESTGTQYIDTGVSGAEQNLIITAGVRINTFGAYVGAFGNYESENANSFRLILTNSNNGKAYANCGYKTQSSHIITNFSLGDWHTVILNGAEDRCFCDGVEYTKGNRYIQGTANANTIRIFTSGGPAAGTWSKQVSAFKIELNGVLVRDYIPVRKGTVGYLYDRVSGKLFGNAGTGDFVLGPDVVPVEYIESHGTEWIDTGVVPADSSVFALNAEIPSTERANAILFGSCTANPTSGADTIMLRTHNYPTTYASWLKSGVYGTTVNYPTGIVEFKMDRGNVYFNGSFAYSLQYGTTTSQLSNVCVLSLSAGQWKKLSCKMYGFRHEINGAVASKLCPVRVGTEGAMMDVLTRRIYRNAGTGAFTYGNDLKYPIPAS